MSRKFVKPLISLFKSGCLTCLVLNYVGDFVVVRKFENSN